MTRAQNQIRRSEAEAKIAENKAQIMEVLAQVSKDPEATIEQKIEVAKLAVELQRGY